ncbi:MAG: hypothetical protein ACRDO2_11530 [Nocardioidaceae bacterium]
MSGKDRDAAAADRAYLIEAIDRAEAGLSDEQEDRFRAGRDRAAAERDREHAAKDRTAAEHDREDAAADRAQAAADREDRPDRQ